jgi:hypothetical protein
LHLKPKDRCNGEGFANVRWFVRADVQTVADKA